VLLQTDVDVNAVSPHIDVVHARQIPLREQALLVLPLLTQPGDRGGRQPSAGAEELLQRGHEIATREPMQVEQRQHLADLRAAAAPRRQDRRGEPLALTGFIDAHVVDPRRADLDRSRRGAYGARIVMTVAHHQPVPGLIELIGQGVDVGVGLGLQRRRQHPPGTLPRDLIQQRTRRHLTRRHLPRTACLHYLEHGRTFPTSVAAPALLDHHMATGKVRPTRPQPQVSSIARWVIQLAEFEWPVGRDRGGLGRDHP